MNEERTRFLQEFKQYAVSGFPWPLRASLYQPLSNMFRHIAHYNSRGFWTAWFSTPKNQAQWLHRVQNWNCYGDPQYCWCDVESALKDWVQHSGIQEMVSARITPAKRPRVLIICDQGLVQDIISEVELDITLVDLDVDNDAQDLELNGKRVDADIRHPGCECDTKKVEEILKSIE